MTPYKTIAAKIENVLSQRQDQDIHQIHVGLNGLPINKQRLGTILSRMTREGRLIADTKTRAAIKYRLSSQRADYQSSYSAEMQERMDIYAFRPLVSAPKVAPLRPIPAWSRQPL